MEMSGVGQLKTGQTRCILAKGSCLTDLNTLDRHNLNLSGPCLHLETKFSGQPGSKENCFKQRSV